MKIKTGQDFIYWKWEYFTLQLSTYFDAPNIEASIWMERWRVQFTVSILLVGIDIWIGKQI